MLAVNEARNTTVAEEHQQWNMDVGVGWYGNAWVHKLVGEMTFTDGSMNASLYTQRLKEKMTRSLERTGQRKNDQF